MRTPPPRSRLDFALPTINIIFLLILYFLVAGSLMDQTEAGIRPPEVAAAVQARLARPVLSITVRGETQLDGRAMTVDAAAAEMVQDGSTTVTVLVAADFPAQRLAAIIGELSTAGLNAQLVTLRDAR